MKPVLGVFHKVMVLIWQHHRIKSTDCAYIHKDVSSVVCVYSYTTFSGFHSVPVQNTGGWVFGGFEAECN